ncbi:nuclear transport factor 2 family protein [Streptomyces sp. NPDC047046]|uniref:nuclear transport factor 2 family protein n=1 Tax=Streptomyces sp. NPDC047046 TaxID=3155378 RepID=UPI0033FCA0D1
MTATELIEDYLGLWNEPEAGARLRAMRGLLADDVAYSDPDDGAVRGHAGLSATIGRVRAAVGDARFALGEVIGAHHGRALFTWRLVTGAGTVATGYDVLTHEDGRVTGVVGFFV